MDIRVRRGETARAQDDDSDDEELPSALPSKTAEKQHQEDIDDIFG